MALGFSFPTFPPFLYLLLFLSLFFFSSSSDGLHVVGRQHALLAGTLHAAIHPAFINLLHVYDHISVHKGNFILIGGRVVVYCPVSLLSAKKNELG